MRFRQTYKPVPSKVRWMCIAFCVIFVYAFMSAPAEGQVHVLRPSKMGSRIASQSLRRKVHINSLITEPGTFEVEWASAFSGSGDYLLPTALKLTPSANPGFWGRTELSVSFDALSSSAENSSNSTQFSDHVSFSATTVFYAGERLNLALAPIASFLLRGDRGARLGAAAIARFDSGLNSAGATITWTGATVSSVSNPSGVWDIGGGLGRRLANSGAWSRLTPHGNIVYERSSGDVRRVSVYEGLEYQVTRKLAFDISGQQMNVHSSSPDHQVVFGITWNLGRFRTWF
jgi:hypothetical protein